MKITGLLVLNILSSTSVSIRTNDRKAISVEIALIAPRLKHPKLPKYMAGAYRQLPFGLFYVIRSETICTVSIWYGVAEVSSST